MVAAVVGVATVAAGAYSANKQSKAAKGAANSARDATDAQVELGREQLDFSRQQYADWQERFNPILDDLTGMAYEDVRPDYGAIAADVGAAFGTSQAMNRRQQERYGIKPTDGAADASERQYGLGRALALVGGNQSARAQAKDAKFQRLAGVYGLGNGMMSGAMSGMNAGYGTTAAALGSQANMFGQQANQYSQAAAAGAQMAGYGLGQLGSMSWGGAQAGGTTVPNSPAWTPPANNGASPWQTGPSPWNTGGGG